MAGVIWIWMPMMFTLGILLERRRSGCSTATRGFVSVQQGSVAQSFLPSFPGSDSL